MPKVDELITDIAKGGLKLPEFQRGYVWTRDQVRTFVQSLYRGHPTGHLLIWHAYGPVKTRGGMSEHAGNTLLLLDGQQRLTTLYALIKGKPPPFYEGEELFFDLWFNVVDEEFSYYNKTLMGGNPVWFSVHEFLGKGMNRFLDDLPELNESQQDLARKSLSKLNRLDKIHSYVYQVDDLKDETLVLDEVVEIFNRVNSKGTPLSRADLAMAHICTFWPEARSVMRGFIKTMADQGFEIEPAFLVRATSAVAGGSVNFDAAFYQLSAQAYQNAWPKVRAAFEYLVNVLRHDAFVDSLSDLSSPIVLVPMLVYLANNGATFADATERDAFLRWMYLANIWGRYTGPTDTKLRRDVASLADPDPTARLIEAIVTDRGRIIVEATDLEGKGSTSGFYKFAYVLARSRGAKDWFTGQTLYSKAVGKSNGLHSHHVFPRAALKQMGTTERAVVNQIANRAFLTQKSNLKIATQEPAAYLPIVEEKFPGVLRQQLIPMHDELWQKANYEEFFERRRKLLARAMNRFLARFGPVGEDAPDRVGINALLQTGESQRLEFKSSLRWDLVKGYTNRDLEDVVVKTAAGFLNADGGDLIIGVDDAGTVLGLENDYDSSKSIANRDGFERHLNGIVRKAIGDATMAFLTMTFHTVEGKDICQLSIEPADHPVYVASATGQVFFVRQGNATRSLDPKETMSYVTTHWKEF
jgi:hypothetical protein